VINALLIDLLLIDPVSFRDSI